MYSYYGRYSKENQEEKVMKSENTRLTQSSSPNPMRNNDNQSADQLMAMAGDERYMPLRCVALHCVRCVGYAVWHDTEQYKR